MRTRVFIVSNIKLCINASSHEAFSLAKGRLRKYFENLSEAKFSIYKRSVDARDKNHINFVYSVAATNICERADEQKMLEDGITVLNEASVEDLNFGEEKMQAPPLVVGAGPCGLFASLLLAEKGYKPTIIERGDSVKARRQAVAEFYASKVLNPNSNIQFGAGGAGTFSDGKLVTRINDKFTSYVLKKLVEFGAPKEILYIAKPHIGTDILSVVVDNILQRIISLGGTIHYNTKYLSSSYSINVSTAHTNRFDIPYSAMILAIGHSARDTYEHLINSDYEIEAKPFSVGMRIEHLADDIDFAMYGKFAGNAILGRAEYNLSYDTKNRGVYTFCMCPGGEVVAAASEEGGVVVNGMSYNARNGKNSNSAIVCSIFKEDYGFKPQNAIEFQRKIEQRAFNSTGGNYVAPIITVGDFFEDKLINEPSNVIPTYMNSSNFKLTKPDDYLPMFVTSQIKNAIQNFDKKIHGFASKSAVLTGVETRTSAPIRILRDPITRLAVGKENVYPAGEGAGYAGGITSAAVDGLRSALSIIQRFKPF